MWTCYHHVILKKNRGHIVGYSEALNSYSCISTTISLGHLAISFTSHKQSKITSTIGTKFYEFGLLLSNTMYIYLHELCALVENVLRGALVGPYTFCYTIMTMLWSVNFQTKAFHFSIKYIWVTFSLYSTNK